MRIVALSIDAQAVANAAGISTGNSLTVQGAQVDIVVKGNADSCGIQVNTGVSHGTFRLISGTVTAEAENGLAYALMAG